MSEQIKLPGINGDSDAEKLQQIRSYLYQLANQLNRTLDTLSAPSGSATTTEDVHLAFSRLRPLIMESSEIASAMGQRLKGTFAAKDSVLCMQSYAWSSVSDLTVQSQPTFQAAGDVCQNFLVFGHIKGSAVLAAFTMIGSSTLLHTGSLTPLVTQNGQFVISGVTGDRITLLSDTPFQLGGST